jgi:tetratricopeptide (TPR) repeat protein
MMRLMGGATVVAVGVMLAPVAAQAQTPALVNARVEISAAVAGSSATLEVIERQANALDRARQAEIAALQTRLIEAEARGASEVARLQAELIAAREALVADLASRDTAYAEEIAVFRREVTDIASTAEGAAALARYNAGDRVGAIAVLDRLRQARDGARRVRADVESAAEARRIATLALDARDKSDPAFDTGAVIARYQEVVRLDPDNYDDWLQLYYLYRDAGRSRDALAATERMQKLSRDEAELGTALLRMGEVLVSQGDRDTALGLYRRSLEISERLSAADPGSGDLARDVIVSLNKIGDVLLSQGDRDGALGLYRRSLEMAERLSAADPASTVLARDVSLLLIKIGGVLLSQGDREGALRFYRRSLEIWERLSAADPTSADHAWGLSTALFRIGEVLLSQGNRDEALWLHRRSLEIVERLSAADPASAVLARDLSTSLETIGDVLLGQGDTDGALGLYRRSLEIRKRLSAADPASVDLARDLGAALQRTGDVLLTQGDRAGALSRYQRSLEIREHLSAADPASADLARDVSASLIKIGDVLVSEGDRAGALTRYQRSLEIAERLSAADPASAERARDVSVSCWRMAQVTGERRYWERALAILKDLEARGALAEADRPFIAQLEEALAAEAE